MILIQKLSDETWALLRLLYRGRRRTPGFRVAYEELRAHGLAVENKITEKGEAALWDKHLVDVMPPRGLRNLRQQPDLLSVQRIDEQAVPVGGALGRRGGEK